MNELIQFWGPGVATIAMFVLIMAATIIPVEIQERRQEAKKQIVVANYIVKCWPHRHK